MSYDEEWFPSYPEFNTSGDSPGGAGNCYEPENITNIPFSDDVQPSPNYDHLAASLDDDYSYDHMGQPPDEGSNGQIPQSGTSVSNDVGGQFQNMHLMQNTDTFDQPQPSTSMAYNSFEMPTVISVNPEVGPYQDLGIDDPTPYYANQQPSTSQVNDLILNGSYDMMVPTTSYTPQMDHMNPSSVGNISSHSGMNHQQDMSGSQVQQQALKPKPKKKATKKKPPPAASDSVGSLLTKANKMNQQIENNNDNKMEARVTQEDSLLLSQLVGKLMQYQTEKAGGTDRTDEIANLEGQIAHIFSKRLQPSDTSQSANESILSQIKSMSCANEPSTSLQQPPPPPPKRAPPKKKPQPKVQQQQQLPTAPLQAQMTPAKIMMDPPTTTLVPSNSQMNSVYDNGSDNIYGSYQPIDDPGTSQQMYTDYHQTESNEPIPNQHQNQIHPQVIQAKVVSTRTQHYQETVVLNSQSSNGPGPSPQFNQPLSHENHHLDQMTELHYRPQDQERPQSQQMYVPEHHQDEDQLYHQDVEPTLGDVVRRTHGTYQGPEDAPNLRQQLINNVNASTNKQVIQRSQASTPSPGHYQNNTMHQQQFAEPFQHHESYSEQHDVQPNSHSQQEYDTQYDRMDEFYEDSLPGQESQTMPAESHPQHQLYEGDMYIPVDDQEPVVEPEIEEIQVPENSVALSKEELTQKLEEKRLIREEAMRNLMNQQLNRLEAPVDLTPFRGKMDVLERMLPYHHFSTSEEPVSNFDSTFQKAMSNAVSHANALGTRIRNIVLRNSMQSSTEWEENMILFLETESERRNLEEDRQLAEEDLHSFLQNSEIIQNVKSNRLNLEKSRKMLSEIPDHLKELNVENGELSALYKEYEFDSYDENRPRGSPLPFVYEEPDSESEPEPEPEPEREYERHDYSQPTRSDLSPLVGFPQPSPLPSPTRFRNESESTFDWKDDDESPLLSPDTVKQNKPADTLSNELFGTQEELDKAEMFPFQQISDETRKRQQGSLQQPNLSESFTSGDNSSSTDNTPHHVQQFEDRTPSPEPSTNSSTIQLVQPKRRPITCNVSATVSTHTPHQMRNRDENEGSPEIDDDFSMSPPEKSIPAEEVPPIPLPVPVHMIKKEKEDPNSKLKLLVPVRIIQKGIEFAVSEDENEIEEIPFVRREPLKMRVNLKDVKLEEQSPERDSARRAAKSKNVTPTFSKLGACSTSSLNSRIDRSPQNTLTEVQFETSQPHVKAPVTTPVFKTPLPTPLKTTPPNSRKRRSDKIEYDGHRKNEKNREVSTTSNFVTPKNGMVREDEPEIGRFIRTMTDGRRIMMRIGKIPSNINHFVTPRRDSKGNMHKDLTATKDTRLKMRLFKKDGLLSVEVTERKSGESWNTNDVTRSNGPTLNGSSAICSIVSTPKAPSSDLVKGRPAPASRKPSVDTVGKDKKNNLIKGKNTFSNRFNPFASSSKPSAPSLSKPPTSLSSSKPTSSVSKPAFSSSKPSTSSSSTVSVSASKNATVSTGFSRSSQQTSTAPVALSPIGIKRKVPQTSTGSTKSLITTTSTIPKITVTRVSAATGIPSKPDKSAATTNTISPLLPWMVERDQDSVKKQTLLKAQSVSVVASSIFPTVSKDHLQVQGVVPATAQQESPRASSSLSMSLFDDDKTGFAFLQSPKRASEPLPDIEFSDNDDDEIAHSTFSHATDHLLGTSNLNQPINGTTPMVPWSTDP